MLVRAQRRALWTVPLIPLQYEDASMASLDASTKCRTLRYDCRYAASNFFLWTPLSNTLFYHWQLSTTVIAFSLAREVSRADHFKERRVVSGCFVYIVDVLLSDFCFSFWFSFVLSNLFFCSRCPIYRTLGVEESTKHRCTLYLIDNYRDTGRYLI